VSPRFAALFLKQTTKFAGAEAMYSVVTLCHCSVPGVILPRCDL